MARKTSISIAVPTLNEERNLDRCLKSIFRQEFDGKLEVFVIDGGSTDSTLRIANKYKVKILTNPLKDAETGKLIGFKKSTSELFMILDADMELQGLNWFNKMLKPLKDDKSIVGSFTKFISKEKDTLLNKYICIDPIQRDPLFRFLTPSIEDTVAENKKGYFVCKYYKNKIVPAGFCIYRRKDLEKIGIGSKHKFMELDNLFFFVKRGFNRFAYVPSAKIYHPFIPNFHILLRKRARNLKFQFFNQPDKREFTWINFNNKTDLIKIVFWIIYANTLVLPALVGIIRAIKYKKPVALYEPIFAWITTNLIIYVFLTEKEGRNLIFKSIFE